MVPSGEVDVTLSFCFSCVVHMMQCRLSDNKVLNPASKELISDIGELCETEVCFLHIQLIGTNV